MVHTGCASALNVTTFSAGCFISTHPPMAAPGEQRAHLGFRAGIAERGSAVGKAPAELAGRAGLESVRAQNLRWPSQSLRWPYTAKVSGTENASSAAPVHCSPRLG